LRDLIKHTPETHCDYNDLCAALEKIKAIASQVDESVEVRKRQLKMLAIQKQFATSLNVRTLGSLRLHLGKHINSYS